MHLNTCLRGSRSEFCSGSLAGGRLLDAGALLVGGLTAAPSWGLIEIFDGTRMVLWSPGRL